MLYAAMSRGRDLDKSLVKSVVSLQKKVPVVYLGGQTCWFLSDFVAKILPALAKQLPDEKFKLEQMRKLDETFLPDVQLLHLQICTWMVRMESSFSKQTQLSDVLTSRAGQLINGVLLAYQVSVLVKQALFLHMSLNAPYTASQMRGILHCIELLKAVQYTYYRKSVIIAETVMHIVRYLCQQVKALPGTARY